MMLRLIIPLTLLLVTACTSSAPKLTRINGKTIVQTERKVLGMPVWTSEDEVLTHEQKEEKIELDRKRREVNLELGAEERQSAMAFWFGTILLAGVPVCIVIGYLSSGWKFWGTMATISGLMGLGFWELQHLVPYFKYIAFALGISGLLWTMYIARNFNIGEYLKKRKRDRNDTE